MLRRRFFISILIFVAIVRGDSDLEEVAPCNPIHSDHCPAELALGTTIVETFETESQLFRHYSTPEQISYTEDGLVLTIDAKYQNPGIRSKFQIMFGRVEAIIKAAPGTGIVSSLYLQSSALDEIDFEWFGGDSYEVQSNYFSKGNVTTYDRGGYHSVKAPQNSFHNYTIDWTNEKLTWYVDSAPVRILANSSSEGYPQTPMAVFMGIWAGGDPENSAGTIAWAGGSTDYSGVPYDMVVSKLVISDYSSGSHYEYMGRSGDWGSIRADSGTVNSRKFQSEAEYAAISDGRFRYIRRNLSNDLEEGDTNARGGPRANDSQDHIRPWLVIWTAASDGSYESKAPSIFNSPLWLSGLALVVCFVVFI